MTCFNVVDLFHRISFALDEKGRPADSFSARPTVLLPSKKAANNSKKLARSNGGPDRNNNVLMEFHLNKVKDSSLFTHTEGTFVVLFGSAADFTIYGG